jgi:hypothetical protein
MDPTYNQVHELVKPLKVSISTAASKSPALPGTYPDGPNNPDGKLLVQPNLNRCMLLEEAKEEIDGGKQDTATAATASTSHCV